MRIEGVNWKRHVGTVKTDIAVFEEMVGKGRIAHDPDRAEQLQKELKLTESMADLEKRRKRRARRVK